MRGAAAGPEILDRLDRMLADGDLRTKADAARAVGAIGPAAATPEILNRMAELLRHYDRDVRDAAERAVEDLSSTAEGVRIFRGRRGKWQARSIADLSR
jgi:HEAT repeat protein